MTVKFHRYIFENDSEEKENDADGKTTDFLREIEKIFSADITGSDFKTEKSEFSDIAEDIAEVAEKLEEIGFKTPNIYSTRTKTGERRLENLTKDGYKDKVSKFLDSMESSSEVQEVQDVFVSDTPVRKEKSYLRHTLASSRKRRILLDTEPNKPFTPVKKSTKPLEPSGTLPILTPTLSR